eukprot:11916809-Alexandrium_andersonii.AAC.1
MSASLVGSEMCIRDRPPTRSPGWASTALAALVFEEADEDWGVARHRDACLLYTSDAADDM